MEKIFITHRNRDGGELWLELVEGTENLYTIHTDEKHEYMLNYACVNFDKLADDAEDFDAEFKYPDGHTAKAIIQSFDPSGGPYITPGYKLDNGYKVSRIYMRLNEPTYFKLVKE